MIAPSLSLIDMNNIISMHHEHMDKVQGRTQIASSIAQGQTKAQHDATHPPATFNVGDWVVVKYVPLTRLNSWVRGPYQITQMDPTGTFVIGQHYIGSETNLSSPTHVSSLEHKGMQQQFTHHS